MDKAVALTIKVTSDARAAGAGIDSATGKVSKLGRAGQVAGRLLAAGLLVAAGAALKFTNAAADDAQSAQKLATTAQKVAGATKAQTASLEDWITAQGKSKGVTDDELRPALEKLLTVTKNVGQARRLASLAEDISARSGKSLESVTQALAKAQTGSVAGLAKYQVQTKDAEGKTRSLAAVQKDLAKAYKGAAADGADTAAGKAKILSVQMGELQEQIGAQLLPVMAKLTAAGLKVVDWISKNTTAAEVIIGSILGLLAVIKLVSLATSAWSAAQSIATGVKAVYAFLTNAETAAITRQTVAARAAAIAQGALNLVMAANPIVLVVLAVLALAAAFVIAYKKSETFRNIVNAAVSGIVGAFSAAVDFIRNHWKAMLIILGGPVGLAVVLIASHFDKVKAAALAVVNWIRDHWPAVRDVLVEAFSAARNKINSIIDTITSAISTAKDVISTVMSGIKSAVQTVVDAFQAVLDKVQAVIDKIQSIPKPNLPDFNPFNRSAAGSAGNGNFATALGLPGRAPQQRVVNIRVDRMFAGSDAAMARELKRLLDLDDRRLSGVSA